MVIAPVPGYLEDYSGSVCIPGGAAAFRYEGGVYTVTLPDGLPAVLHLPDGTRKAVSGGTHRFSLK